VEVWQVKVLKPGRKQLRVEVFEGECPACGCVMQAERHELQRVIGAYYEHPPSGLIECPGCGKGVWLERKMIEKATEPAPSVESKPEKPAGKRQQRK